MSAATLASSQRAVSPRDCALAVGLPLDARQFYCDLESGNGRDFARSIRRRYRVSPEGAWNLYRGDARYLGEVCDAAEQAGVLVDRAATAEALRSMFAQRTIVTIVSHLRVKELSGRDVVDPAGLLAAVRTGTDPVSRHLRELTEDVDDSDTGLSRLVELLREVAVKALEDSEDETGAARSERGPDEGIPSQYLHRIFLETRYPAHIRPGPVIDLAAGACTTRELVRLIPSGFDGIVDLTVCNSSFLAPPIKTARPSCLVAINRKKASTVSRMVRYRVAVESLSRVPRPFGEVLADVHSMSWERIRP